MVRHPFLSMVNDQDKRDFNKGYLKVPVSLIGVFLFMTLQTGSFIWWASKQTTTLQFIREQQEKNTKLLENNGRDRYTSFDANKDRIEYSKRMTEIQSDLKGLERQVNTFQSKYEGILDSLTDSKRK